MVLLGITETVLPFLTEQIDFHDANLVIFGIFLIDFFVVIFSKIIEYPNLHTQMVLKTTQFYIQEHYFTGKSHPNLQGFYRLRFCIPSQF